MREIKFRVWRSGERGMYYFPLVYQTTGMDEWSVTQLGSGLAIDIMQYTGLKDKNGKEIYEGDIVRTIYDTVGAIAYNLGQFDPPPREVPDGMGGRMMSHAGYGSDGSFTIDESKPGYKGLRNINTVAEVIGNIYENPELLDKEKL